MLTIAIGLFFTLYAVFLVGSLDATTDDPAKFGEWWVRLATGLSASLGAFLAALLGIKVNTEPNTTNRLRSLASAARRLGPDEYQKLVLTVGIWGYLVVGGLCGILWGFKQGVTPDVVRNQAAIAIGAVVATLSATISPQQN